MKKIFIHETVSCSERRLDLKKISSYFQRNGHEVCDNPCSADLIVLSTCAYSNERSDYSLKMVEKFKKYKAELLVIGCLPDIEPERFKKIFSGRSLSTKNLNKIDGLFPEHKIKFDDIDEENLIWDNCYKEGITGPIFNLLTRLKYSNKLYLSIKGHVYKHLFGDNPSYYFLVRYWRPVYFLKISDGCLGDCSYCAIKKAIGPLRSKPVDVIVSEFEKGLEQGYKNFSLAGDDIGSYGIDIGENFTNLLEKITSIEGDYDFDLRDVGAVWIDKYIDDLENILKKGKIHDVCVPIQSGNRRILKLMNRFNDIEQIGESVSRFKNAFPDLKVGTGLIAGFPTETHSDFHDSLKLVEKINFDWGYILPFSCKSCTKAATIEPKISRKQTYKRMKFAGQTLRKMGYNVKHFRGISYNIMIFDKL